MKIREFFSVSGFDPEICGSGSYRNGNTLGYSTPCCPLAHAAVLRGANIENDSVVLWVQDNCGIGGEVLGTFTSKYDCLCYTSEFNKTEAFNIALSAAEEEEKNEVK